MEYTLTLNSTEDYKVIKKILKAFEGAKIRPNKKVNDIKKDSYTIEDALEEVRNGEIVGPFRTVDEFMKDLLS